jgi:hypothetical protein
MPGITGVRLNPFARSVTITYDPARLDLAALRGAATMAGIRIVGPDSPNGTPSASHGDGTELAEAIVRLARRADRRVIDATGGVANLDTLVPIGLSALAIREIVAGRLGAAPWYVLLWYAVDTFRKARRSGRADPAP